MNNDVTEEDVPFPPYLKAKKDLDLTHIEDLVKFFRRLLLKREEDEAKTLKAGALHDS